MNERLLVPTFTVFTVEEENLICIYDTSSRKALMDSINGTVSDFEESELVEIADRVLRALNAMTDDEYAALTFHPAYQVDDDDNEVEVQPICQASYNIIKPLLSKRRMI